MDFALLQTVPLFSGFSTQELARLLQDLSPTEKSFERGETLLMAGDNTHQIGIVLYGAIEATKDTRQGGQFLVARMGPGGVFGDVLSAGHTKSPVTVTAHRRCRVLFLPCQQVLAPPVTAQGLHVRLLANLVGVISDKYFLLDGRVDLLLIRGLRRRVSAYLLEVAARRGGDAFTIPYNRTQLAGYLGCERSALSRELSRMVKEGIIETNGPHFCLLRPDTLRDA